MDDNTILKLLQDGIVLLGFVGVLVAYFGLRARPPRMERRDDVFKLDDD